MKTRLPVVLALAAALALTACAPAQTADDFVENLLFQI